VLEETGNRRTETESKCVKVFKCSNKGFEGFRDHGTRGQETKMKLKTGRFSSGIFSG
jgi:hypothetical protein